MLVSFTAVIVPAISLLAGSWCVCSWLLLLQLLNVTARSCCPAQPRQLPVCHQDRGDSLLSECESQLRRLKNQIQKFTSASLSFRRQDFTGQTRNIGEFKCLIFFWSVAAYLVKYPALLYDPAVSSGILSAAIMLTVVEKTLQGQWEMMHDRAVERGSKYNVPCPWDFSRGGNSLNTLLALGAYKEQV